MIPLVVLEDLTAYIGAVTHSWLFPTLKYVSTVWVRGPVLSLDFLP